MSAHTKGPWAIRVGHSFEDGGTGYYELQGAPWKPSGDGARFAILDGVSEADLRLIVAAPDMLEALRWIVEIADKNYEHDDKLRSNGARTLMRISDRAQIEIAKATGAA